MSSLQSPFSRNSISITEFSSWLIILDHLSFFYIIKSNMLNEKNATTKWQSRDKRLFQKVWKRYIGLVLLFGEKYRDSSIQNKKYLLIIRGAFGSKLG